MVNSTVYTAYKATNGSVTLVAPNGTTQFFGNMGAMWAFVASANISVVVMPASASANAAVWHSPANTWGL